MIDKLIAVMIMIAPVMRITIQVSDVLFILRCNDGALTVDRVQITKYSPSM